MVSKEEEFVPTELQQRIFKALRNKQITTDTLMGIVGCDRKQFFSVWGIKGLVNRGLVANKYDRKGFYRPDKPPLLEDTPEG